MAEVRCSPPRAPGTRLPNRSWWRGCPWPWVELQQILNRDYQKSRNIWNYRKTQFNYRIFNYRIFNTCLFLLIWNYRKRNKDIQLYSTIGTNMKKQQVGHVAPRKLDSHPQPSQPSQPSHLSWRWVETSNRPTQRRWGTCCADRSPDDDSINSQIRVKNQRKNMFGFFNIERGLVVWGFTSNATKSC